MRIAILILLCASMLQAEVGFFITSYKRRLPPYPRGDALPATCAVDDLFEKFDSPNGVYLCIAPNTWLRVKQAVFSRYCAMNDFSPQIKADGGVWHETEFLGNRCLVKVRASATTLSAIASTTGFRRIPLNRLDDPLSSLTTAQRNRIRNEILDAGYSLAELQADIPDLSAATLRQALRFLTKRRLKPRYDAVTDTLFLDGPVQPVTDAEVIDTKVTE